MKSKKAQQFEIIEHYSTDDEDCSYDYHAVDVLIDGVIVKSYGNYYDDKGDIAARAFLEGYFLAANTQMPLITYTTLNDYEY